MEETSFFVKHGASLIAVSSTLIGIIVTQLFNYLNKQKEFGERSKESALERDRDFQKTNIIDPLLRFLEQDLKMAQQVYSNGLHQKSDAIECDHQVNMVMLSAKIQAMDSKLHRKYEEYTREKVALNTKALSEDEHTKDIDGAYKSLEKLKLLASEIILGLSKHYSKRT